LLEEIGRRRRQRRHRIHVPGLPKQIPCSRRFDQLDANAGAACLESRRGQTFLGRRSNGIRAGFRPQFRPGS
jgi:hypothetical protein